MRATEPDFALVECLTAENHCLITARCRMRGVLQEALGAFWQTLDSYILADLLIAPDDFDIKRRHEPGRDGPGQAAQAVRVSG